MTQGFNLQVVDDDISFKLLNEELNFFSTSNGE